MTKRTPREERLYKAFRTELGASAKNAADAIRGLRVLKEYDWTISWQDDWDEETGEKLNLVRLLDQNQTEVARGWEHTFSSLGKEYAAGGMAWEESKYQAQRARMPAYNPRTSRKAPRRKNALLGGAALGAAAALGIPAYLKRGNLQLVQATPTFFDWRTPSGFDGISASEVAKMWQFEVIVSEERVARKSFSKWAEGLKWAQQDLARRTSRNPNPSPTTPSAAALAARLKF